MRDDTVDVDSAGALDALVEGIGDPIESGARNPFLVRGDRVWIVRSGQVDIFSVRTDGNTPVGPRTHLVRVGAGAALFGHDAGHHGSGEDTRRRLLAVGVN